MKKAFAISNKVTTAVAYVGVVCLVFMMLYTTADVVWRAVSSKPFNGTYELIQCAFFICLFSGFAYCQTNHSHLHVTMLLGVLPKKGKLAAWGIGHLISCLMGIMLVIAGFQQTQVGINTRTYTGLLHIPFYPFYFIGAVCMLAFVIVLLMDTVYIFAALKNDDYAEDILGDWV